MITRSGSYKLFNAFGIDVFVHWTWFLAAWLLYTWSGFSRVPNGLFAFLAVYGSLFGIVLLHEFGHALACRSVGGKANLIVLWPLGGVAYVAPPPRPGAVLWSIAAGPLVNAALVPILYGLQFAASGLGQGNTATLVQTYLYVIAAINIALLVFNMLPIYPLDGGQILQSILWFFIGRARSLRATSFVGFLVAAVAFVLAAIGESDFIPISRFMLLLLSAFVAWQAFKGFQIARLMAHQEAHETQSIERALQRAREMAMRRD